MAIQDLGLRTPHTIEPLASARVAVERMEKDGIGCLVVVDGKRPVGVVTDRDLVLHVLVGKRDARLVRVGEIAKRSPVTVSATATLAEVTRAMRTHGVRRLPVVDEHGELVGLVALDDLLRRVATEIGDLAEALRHQFSGEIGAASAPRRT
ncbi:MAG TPA: CBS domain-containing protein [Deltaproteobacteria bacterium]|jgi:CBS domain-containing protein|nr:CBS domain-containing protein [Deltaproteobacteria bacterium]